MPRPATGYVMLADPSEPMQLFPEGVSPRVVRAVADWRIKAIARLADALSQFDENIIGGSDPVKAARHTVRGFMHWARKSMAEVAHDLGTPRDDAFLRADEQAFWDVMGEAAVSLSAEEPVEVDDFLGAWLDDYSLTVVQGYAR